MHINRNDNNLALNSTALALAALLAFAPAILKADTQFQVRRMTRSDVPLSKGQCDIRLRVDGEVEVSVQQDSVDVRTLSGREASDDGSECNEPLPRRVIEGFDFEKLDGRGDMQLLAPPNRQSGFRAVVKIRDADGGEGRYHFRLSWVLDGAQNSGPGTIRPSDDERYGDRGRYGNEGGRYPDNRGRNQPPYGRTISSEDAIRSCGESVRARLDRDFRYSNVEIVNARVDDDQPGRNDVITGEAIGRRGRSSEPFVFSCSVNLANGNIRNVDVQRR